ncbi:MAG: hypothetical protein M1835_005320 [Candelina submexicana]|nr:MAG: hypothetical protein M1835_005320 [Candelina submexicana]
MTTRPLPPGAEAVRPYRPHAFHHGEAQLAFEKFRTARARFDRRRVMDRYNLANARHRLTEVSPTGDHLHFLRLPGEIRNQIYRLLLTSKDVRRTVENGAPIYEFTPSILRVNRQIHDEAIGILYLENRFVGITATCGRLRHIVIDNFLPRISMGDSTKSHNFPQQALEVQVHSSPTPVKYEKTFALLILLEDLPAFCAMLWMCCGVCKHIGKDGVIDLRIPYSHPPRLIEEQRQLLLPFTRIHSFNKVNITGTVNPSLVRDLVTAITGRRTYVAEQIVGDALRMDEEVNAALVAKDHPTSLFKSRQAFAILTEITHPRFRGSYYPLLSTTVNGGPFNGKQFIYVIKELGFKMIITLAFIYIRMEDWEKARALAEHTSTKIRSRFQPSKKDMGRLIVMQAVASEGIGEFERAEKEFGHALTFLPNERMIVRKLMDLRLKLRMRRGDPFALLTHRVVFLESGNKSCSPCDRQRFLGKVPAV